MYKPRNGFTPCTWSLWIAKMTSRSYGISSIVPHNNQKCRHNFHIKPFSSHNLCFIPNSLAWEEVKFCNGGVWSNNFPFCRFVFHCSFLSSVKTIFDENFNVPTHWSYWVWKNGTQWMEANERARAREREREIEWNCCPLIPDKNRAYNVIIVFATWICNECYHPNSL